MIYKRNYSILSKSELKQKKLASVFYEKAIAHDGLSLEDLRKYHKMLPNASYFYDSLFPNNFLKTGLTIKRKEAEELLSDFKTMVNKQDTTERSILNFINQKESYHLLESLFTYYNFGHHGAFLFKEFPLGTNYVADYLLIGKNSGGYEFIFIELEDPYKRITLKNGDFGNGIRKGISQTEDWKKWIESHFVSLRSTFAKYKNEKHTLPTEFIDLDTSRMHFMVIAGRRQHYLPKTYTKRRDIRGNVILLHFDNMIYETSDFLNINKIHFNE